MRFLSILALLLAASCSPGSNSATPNSPSSNPTTCASNTDCQVGLGLTCNTTTSKCDCAGITCAGGQRCLGGVCANLRRVFTTSELFTPGTPFDPSCLSNAIPDAPCTFNGTADADNACQAAANNGKLGGRWMAWMADSKSPVLSRFIPNHIADLDDLNVYLVDGHTFVSGSVNKSELVRGDFASACTVQDASLPGCPATHAHEINMDQYKVNHNGTTNTNAWTGIDAGGFVPSSSPNLTCNDWTSSDGTKYAGIYGSIKASDVHWRDNYNVLGGSTVQTCSNQRLYCMEVNQ